MKGKFLLVFALCLGVAISFPLDDDYAFDIYDEKWDESYEHGDIEDMTMEELVVGIREFSDEPEFQQLADSIEELIEIAENLDYEETHKYVDPDAFRTICQMVTDKGYPCEEHHLKTPDGFFLRFFRIPRGKNNPYGGPPVLLSHGLFDTSGTWLINHPHNSLGYMMADAGFDVWMGNIRGNKYGDTHETYNRYQKQLWAHSFDEHGAHDIPATIDYILSATNHTKVGVVGHSQGCAQMFSLMSQNPQYSSKVSIFGALAPAGYMRYQSNVIINTAVFLRLAELLHFFGIYKAIPLPDVMYDVLPYLCHVAPRTIEMILSLIMGPNRGEWDYSRTSVMCAHSLGGTSMQNMVHWSQLIRSKKFQYHDYGYWGNRDRYGQGSPRVYDIKREWPSSVPIAVYYGGRDDLSPRKDVEQLISDLPVPPIRQKLIDRYAHEDVLWAVTAEYEIYYDLIQLFKDQYNM